MADGFSSSEASAPSQICDRRLLRNIPANEFMSKIEQFSSPQVTIRVKDRDFRLPKDLLCYNSTYFDQKLNSTGNGSKVENITCVLPFGSPKSFELVVQWMYTANIVLSPPQQRQLGGPNGKVQEGTAKEKNGQQKSNMNPVDLTIDDPSVLTKSIHTSGQPRKSIGASNAITSYLQFFKLADELDLLGPFDIIIRRIRAILCSSERSLLPEHIRSAAELPRGHEVRKLFAEACVTPYMTDVKVQYSREEFPFTAELNEVDPFAVDLFHEFNLAVRQGSMEMDHTALFFVFKDPLTGRLQRLPCAYKRI